MSKAGDSVMEQSLIPGTLVMNLSHWELLNPEASARSGCSYDYLVV